MLWMPKTRRRQMKPITKKIKDLKPYKYNPIIHPESQLEALRHIYRKYGQQDPLLIKKDGEIIDGHARVKAWEGLTDTVECYFCDDWSEPEIREYRLWKKRSSESEWDIELVKYELDSLKIQEPEIKLLGFEDVKIEPAIKEKTKIIDTQEYSHPENYFSQAKDDIYYVTVALQKSDIEKIEKHLGKIKGSFSPEQIQKLLDIFVSEIDMIISLTLESLKKDEIVW